MIKNIPDNSIDLAIIDPPYKFTGGGKMAGIFKDRGKRYFDAIEGKGLDNNYDLKILDEILRTLKRINIYIWCNKEQLHQYFDYFENKNCLFEVLIWNKTNPIPLVNNQYITDKEYCMYFRERGCRIEGTYETKKTVYTSQTNVEDKKKYKHPTIKPLKIIKNLIINSSKEGDIVLDCFSRKWDNLCGKQRIRKAIYRNRNRSRISQNKFRQIKWSVSKWTNKYRYDFSKL